jgi:hypothetical protein
MNYRNLILLFAACACTAPCTLTAADDAPRWQLLAGYAFDYDRYTFTTDPAALSPLLAAAFPGYIDGFVLADDSDNIGGRTGNWGYQRADQASARPDFLRYDQVTGIDPALIADRIHRRLNRHGLTLGLRRLLGEQQKWVLDLDLYFASNRARLRTDFTLPTVGLYADHALGGVVPPTAPYAGRFESMPGMPRLGFTPQYTAYSGGYPVEQAWDLGLRSRQLDATLAIARRFELDDRSSFTLRGGLGLEFNRVEYTLDEVSSFRGTTIRQQSLRHDRRWEKDVYFFAGAELSYILDDARRWQALLAGDYRWERDTVVYLGYVSRYKTPLRFRVALRRVF